jgi:hypothetical protein
LWSKKSTWWRDEPDPSTINEKTIADFTRVVEQTGILIPEIGLCKCPSSPTAALLYYGDARSARLAL